MIVTNIPETEDGSETLKGRAPKREAKINVINKQSSSCQDPLIMDLVSPQNNPNNYPSPIVGSNTIATMVTTATPTSSTATPTPSATTPSRYENQKRRDWNTFCQYLRNHRPPLSLSMCSGAHVLEFLRYLDQFGKTKVHNLACPFFGLPNPPAPCPCPLRQAWGSLDALIGRLRAAYEEHGGRPEGNPFGARAVRIFLREVRDFQAKARGVSYEKKRKRPKQKVAVPSAQPPAPPPATLANDANATKSSI